MPLRWSTAGPTKARLACAAAGSTPPIFAIPTATSSMPFACRGRTVSEGPAETGGRSLEKFPIHLGKGATAVPQPEFPRDERAMAWYMDYGARHGAEGSDCRLV